MSRYNGRYARHDPVKAEFRARCEESERGKMRPPPPSYSFRFDTYMGLGLGRPYTTDGDGNFRCKVCDALLMRKARKCDHCKAQKRLERQHGRHRRRDQESRYGGYSPGKNSSELRVPSGLKTPAPSRCASGSP